MIVSRKIISQWLDISKISDQEIADALNNLGFEVEKIINLEADNTNLIVGEIIDINKHPNANKLNICKVNIKNQELQIICGANNIKVGNKVVVAKNNSELASNLKIAIREIQGVRSYGMICSLSELGLNKETLNNYEANGIINLPENAIIGDERPLKYINLDETIFEIQLTLNRSDCLSMYHLAKELSVYFKIKFNQISISDLSVLDKNSLQVQTVPSLVTALTTLKISYNNKEQIETDSRTSRILQLAGIKPQNFFEDITNIVMLELGQPILAFNSDLITRVSIDYAKKDDTSNSLLVNLNDIIFCNEDKPFSVIGYDTSESFKVKNSHHSILFFSINVNQLVMQKVIKQRNQKNSILLTRLSKSVVPDYSVIALQRLIYLLKLSKFNFQIVKFTNDLPYHSSVQTFEINWNDINKILGTNYQKIEIIETLQQIGCQVFVDNDELQRIKILPANHRNDLKNVYDFSEEVLRIKGYASIESIKPKLYYHKKEVNELEDLVTELRKYLIYYGFNYVKTYNLTNKNSLLNFNYFDHKQSFELLAPNSKERAVMRFSLVESLLNICKANNFNKQENLKFVTDDTIYTADKKINDYYLTFLSSENILPNDFKSESYLNNNFFVLKGLLTAFLEKKINNFQFSNFEYQSISSSTLNSFNSAKLLYESLHFATIGCIHPKITKAMGLSSNIYFCEINCNRLLEIVTKLQKKVNAFKHWSKFNPLSRDLSVIIPSKVNYSEILNTINTVNTAYLEKIKLKDYYVDEKLTTENLHSLTFNLLFSCDNAQLDENKISGDIEKIKAILTEKFKATIR